MNTNKLEHYNLYEGQKLAGICQAQQNGLI